MDYERIQDPSDHKPHKTHKATRISEKEMDDDLGSLSRMLKKTKNHQKHKNAPIKESMLDLEVQPIKTEEAFYAKSILQNILESTIEYSIVATDLDGKIIVWNQGAYRNYGYHATEMENKKNILDLHKPEDIQSGAAQNFMQKTLREGKAEEEFERLRKDGSNFIASVTLALRRDNEGNPIGYVMISKDITKAKQIENQLIKTNEELEQFAYIASHDLKAPLRAIERLATWIEEDNIDKLDEKSKEHLALLRQRTLRLANLIDGILQYSRAGRLDLNLELVNTKEILKEIIENLNPDGRFEVHYPQNMPIFKTAKIPLMQVLSNLLGNSIKHHHRKKGTIKIEIESLGAFYLFTIKDDGPGIPSEFFDKIFVVFQTLKSRDEFESTGVGLSIVKKIVESQGGRVMVQSQVERGTTMSFTWPKQIRK
ncbi:PAS domain-containing sensor histidine kinase [Legionella qingyii]|uniref:histidine kinase n=2 Tax=Legionella qingyii TaxID=2184757 RepID=A0A317U4K2_9GAMM|nr:ATP-binding protein [Legionella qingyii]PWY55747.1 PAS domain-containing sensor histidine kinase [Legionella qingyii]RUR21676.1 PAS domain S-box protein [Legionella qingyii]RUR25147.1 PAS domain S-box protein [Legionella qingyii]